MKRSNYPFPFNDFLPMDFVKRAWENGWLDEFADNHFLILAIEDRLNHFDWEHQFVSNTTMDFFTPLNSDGTINFHEFAYNFIVNLSTKLAVMEFRFGTQQIQNFVVNQLSAGKTNYSIDNFFQALSEIEILSFYCRIDWDNYIYEPPLNAHGKKPEARFEGTFSFDDNLPLKIQVNIEVKTPKFPLLQNPNRRVAIPTVLLSDEGRQKFQLLCQQNNVKDLLPRITKLVDFLNSAASKFEIPKKNQYNILYINWSYSDFPLDGFLEPWSLLSNELNGILTHPKIAGRLSFNPPLNPDIYNKISTIIVYSSSIDQLMFSDFRYVWKKSLSHTQQFRMFVLDKELEKRELSSESSILFEITGMKPSISEKGELPFLLNPSVDEDASRDQKIKHDLFKQELYQVIEQHHLT